MDDSVDTVLSGCSGAGQLDVGFHAGLRRVGRTGRTVAYIEREAFACEVLASRMEEGRLDAAPIFSDYCQFPAGRFSGLVDWLCAGIPCQGNSLAGKRQLGDDPRNLWPATRRLLRDMGCSGLFLENVYGLLVPDRKGKRCAPIARILGELSEDGFDAAWTTLSSRETGNSQIRERVFVLGIRRGSELAHGGHDGHCEFTSGTHRERNESRHEYRTPSGTVAGSARDAGRLHAGRRRPGEGTRLDRGGGDGMADAMPRGQRAGGESKSQSDCESDSVPMAGCLRVPAQGLRGVGQRGSAAHALEGLFSGGGAIPMPYPRECPPGPTDYDAWERVLAVRPDLAPALGRLCEIEGIGMEDAAESAFYRVADAMAGELDAALRYRAHRLRLCGNGVDPVVASEAFVRLWRELTAR